MAPKSTARGKANVHLDGAKDATVDLFTSTTLAREVVFSKDGLNPTASHTLNVQVLGTSGHPRVDADVFTVLS